MNLLPIQNQQDYAMCLTAARKLDNSEKSRICSGHRDVFYAELELHLNWRINHEIEKWSFIFLDYNFMPPINEPIFDIQTTFHVFFFQPDLLTILLNAKVKYSCLHCGHEWTTARGRAVFQAERPSPYKYNILFVHLFSQRCEICTQDVEPSWYVDETVRVVRHVCRTLIDSFYTDPNVPFALPPPSPPMSPPSSSPDEPQVQRSSEMRRPHNRRLCVPCQQRSCFDSHRRRRWRRRLR